MVSPTAGVAGKVMVKEPALVSARILSPEVAEKFVAWILQGVVGAPKGKVGEPVPAIFVIKFTCNLLMRMNLR